MIEENCRKIKKNENILEKNLKLVLKKCEPKQWLNSGLRTRKTHAIPTELIARSLESLQTSLVKLPVMYNIENATRVPRACRHYQ